MPRLLKYLLYLFVFVFSFVIFLYWSFPYDVVKERVIGAVEQQFGGKYEVTAEGMSPYWFSGIEMNNVLLKPVGGDATAALKIKDAYGRVSLFSLLFGSPRVSFTLETTSGDVDGSVKLGGDMMSVNLYLDSLNLDALKPFTSSFGISMTGKMNGKVDLMIDRQNVIRSEGKVLLDFSDVVIAESNLKLGEMELPLPETVLTKKTGSKVELEIGKGSVLVKTLKFTEGDLQLDVTGKVFLAASASNYRFNLSGIFKPSEKLEKALPFLFVVEKQKREDGAYPIAIAGRIARPIIKVGTFTLPI